MTSALEDLSKQLGVIPRASSRAATPGGPSPEPALEDLPIEDVEPQTMSEILHHLVQIDQHIEASSLVKTDGTILASAISRRITDTLFATIASTLGQIGADMIRAVDSGPMRHVSLVGETGILYLAPVVNDILLIILTTPQSKTGVINVAVHKVRGMIKRYLNV